MWLKCIPPCPFCPHPHPQPNVEFIDLGISVPCKNIFIARYNFANAVYLYEVAFLRNDDTLKIQCVAIITN